MTDPTASPFSSVAGYPDQVTNPTPFPITYTVSGQSVVLTWTAVTGALYYDVYLGTSIPEAVREVTELTATTYTLNNLLINQLYYCQVIAYLGPQNSQASVVQQVVIATTDDPLLGVTGLVLSGSTGRKLYGFR